MGESRCIELIPSSLPPSLPPSLPLTLGSTGKQNSRLFRSVKCREMPWRTRVIALPPLEFPCLLIRPSAMRSSQVEQIPRRGIRAMREEEEEEEEAEEEEEEEEEGAGTPPACRKCEAP